MSGAVCMYSSCFANVALILSGSVEHTRITALSRARARAELAKAHKWIWKRQQQTVEADKIHISVPVSHKIYVEKPLIQTLERKKHFVCFSRQD